MSWGKKSLPHINSVANNRTKYVWKQSSNNILFNIMLKFDLGIRLHVEIVPSLKNSNTNV